MSWDGRPSWLGRLVPTRPITLLGTRSMDRPNRLFFACLAPLLLVGCGAAGPEGLPIPEGPGTVIREGLPHPMMEAKAFQAEKDGPKAKVEVGGYPLYKSPLVVEGNDRRDLLAILNNPASYRAFSGEKKCGGFHPDDAIEWTVGGESRTLLLCFGCDEAKLVAPNRVDRFDLAPGIGEKLRRLLDAHRVNRPEPGSGNR